MRKWKSKQKKRLVISASKARWTLHAWSGVISKIIEDADPRSLLSAAAVRRVSRRMLQLATSQSLEDWTVHLEGLPAAADFVAGVVRDRYPDRHPPFHARWRHFVFEGRDLWAAAAAAR